MRLLVLCPTYGRPRLLANAVACFEAQTYPDRRMVILDDAGQIAPQTGLGWELFSTPERFASLPLKYDWLLHQARGDWDAAVVWDDDDIYLPWHLSAVADALWQGTTTTVDPNVAPHASHRDRWGAYTSELVRSNIARAWSHPRRVWSLYTGTLQQEDAAGRFYGSLAVGRTLLEQLGGWLGVMPPGHDRRADFDQRMIAACQAAAGDPGRPDDHAPPSYVFRWGSTAAPHCQGLMRAPDDETWYGRYAMASVDPIETLTPKFDEETRRIYERLARSVV